MFALKLKDYAAIWIVMREKEVRELHQFQPWLKFLGRMYANAPTQANLYYATNLLSLMGYAMHNDAVAWWAPIATTTLDAPVPMRDLKELVSMGRWSDRFVVGLPMNVAAYATEDLYTLSYSAQHVVKRCKDGDEANHVTEEAVTVFNKFWSLLARGGALNQLADWTSYEPGRTWWNAHDAMAFVRECTALCEATATSAKIQATTKAQLENVVKMLAAYKSTTKAVVNRLIGA